MQGSQGLGLQEFSKLQIKKWSWKKKEDFRHFMLDSHESLGEETLSKSPCKRALYVCRKRPYFDCPPYMVFMAQTVPGGEVTSRSDSSRACLWLRTHGSISSCCLLRRGGKWNSLCRHSQGVKAVFWVSGCLLQRGNGGRGCHAEQWSHPTPYPTDGQVGNRVMWAGNGCIPRGVGQAFICCESMLCLWCWWVWLVGWSRSPMIIRWSQWNLLRHSAHLKIRLFMGLLSTESICTTHCGAAQVPEPKS